MDRTDERLAMIIRALEKRVEYLDRSVQNHPGSCTLRGRLWEARDQLENIRILAQPGVVEART